MINPRPGFKPYPIRKNAIGRTSLHNRQEVQALKHSSAKASQSKQDRDIKTPDSKKAFKRNSMNYRKKDINYNTTNQQPARLDQSFKLYRDSCEDRMNNYCKVHVFDNIQLPQNKFSMLQNPNIEEGNERYYFSDYHPSALRSKKSYERVSNNPLLKGGNKGKRIITYQHERCNTNDNMYDQKKAMSSTTAQCLQNLKPETQGRKLVYKQDLLEPQIPWKLSNNTQQMLDECANIQSEISKNYRLKLKEQKLQVKGRGHASVISHINDVSPKTGSPEHNIISHQGSRKVRDSPFEDSEYFSCDNKNQIRIRPADESYHNTVKETLKTKILSPKLFEMKEAFRNSKRYLAQQNKSKEAFRYISIYRKALRNSKDLSSSRTDLRIQENNNDYDQELLRTNYKQNFTSSELESDLLQTEHSQHNKSAREVVGKDRNRQRCELPKINGHLSCNRTNTIEKHAHPSTLYMKTIGLLQNVDIDLKEKGIDIQFNLKVNQLSPHPLPSSPISKLLRCVSEKSIPPKSQLLRDIKGSSKQTLEETPDEIDETRATQETRIQKIIMNKPLCSALRKKKVNNQTKDTSKLTDYESFSVQRNKKPRVPRTKRPKIKLENKEMLSSSIFIPKPLLERKKSCEIKIYKQDYTHLDDSKINRVFRDFNLFLKLTFKNKEEVYNFPAIKKIAKTFGIPINVALIQEKGFKDKTIASPIKEKLLFYLWTTLNSENSFSLKNTVKKGYSKCYKYFIGKGNNCQLLKAIMNQRYWWQFHHKDDLNELNFHWTEWKKNAELDKLPSKLPKPVKVTEAESEDESDENKNEAEDGKLIPSAKYIHTMLPEQNLPHDSKKLYNKVEENQNLTSKKLLFLNMKTYYESLGMDPFDVLPLTFHIKKGQNDEEFAKFKLHYYQQKEKAKEGDGSNVWIIKPGENSNRGDGISVSDSFEEIREVLNDLASRSKRTCIVQKYIDKPLLINKRKFDIRIFAYVTCYNEGYMKGYYYNEGYLRTSCKEYTLDDLENTMIHLTNDAVQKHDDDYGKYELANKLSYDDFQKYLDVNHKEKYIDLYRDILPQIRAIIADSLRAVHGKIDPYQRANTFEVLGYDFMIDEDFKIYLIEVNTNPCLDRCCPLLARLIPSMLENAFLIGLDPIFMPQEGFLESRIMAHELCKENKFELIFDSDVDK